MDRQFQVMRTLVELQLRKRKALTNKQQAWHGLGWTSEAEMTQQVGTRSRIDSQPRTRPPSEASKNPCHLGTYVCTAITMKKDTTMNTKSLISTILGISLALLAGSCSESDPVEASPERESTEVMAWFENVPPGSVIIRDMETDESGTRAWEFGIGSPCNFEWTITGSNGNKQIGSTLAGNTSNEASASIPFKRSREFRFATVEVEGDRVLGDLAALVGSEAAAKLEQAHPELKDSSMLRFNINWNGSAGYAGTVPSSVRKPSDEVGVLMSGGRVGPDTVQMGKTIYLASHITFKKGGSGSIKEMDGEIYVSELNEEGVMVDVPLTELETPSWVLSVKFEAIE